jgi:hypothetical protein
LQAFESEVKSFWRERLALAQTASSKKLHAAHPRLVATGSHQDDGDKRLD